MKPDLPPIPFVLTPAERTQADIIACLLERNRRRQNELDAQRKPRRTP